MGRKAACSASSRTSTARPWTRSSTERRRPPSTVRVERHFVLMMLVVAATVAPATAQQASETLLLLRTATTDGAYHLVEAIHQRGRVVPLDVGYIDFDNPAQYREMWVGGGGVPFQGPKAFLITEGLLARAFGAHGAQALYFQPYFFGIYRVAPKLPFEASYFAYVPLNEAATTQHLLERAKLEYDFARFKVGAGYSAYRFGREAWRHKPFITATLKAGMLGNFELWLQRVPDDQVAVQFRYAKVFIH